MIGFVPLASGSKGNCLYLGTPSCKILIDAGLSGAATKRKLAEIGVSIDDIDAVVISHEHGDHITGLKVLAYGMGIPVLANHETAKAIVDTFHEVPTFKIFSTGEPFQFQDIEIHPFSVQHDTIDPVMFTFKTCGVKLGVCTDLGFATSLVRNHLRDCDYLYIEANHQPSMVHASPRPMVYKQRVLGRSGHLSNDQCGEIVAEVAHEGLKKIWLAHLSSECNSPITALEVVKGHLSRTPFDIPIHIAHQDRVSDGIAFEAIPARV